MSRSSPTQDNLFLRSYTQFRRRCSNFRYAVPLLVLLPLLALLLLTLWFGKVELQRDIGVQADRVGTALARQIASTAAEPLAAGDNLSLNILLAEWNQNPLIAHVSLYSPNNRVIAEAGNKPAAHNRAPGQGRYMAAVLRQDQVAGQIQLVLAAQPFRQPGTNLMVQLIWALLAIALVSGLTAWFWAARLRRDLSAIAEWDATPIYPAPASARHDELGDFARTLTQQRGLYPEPEPEPEPIEDIDISAVTADISTATPAQPSEEVDADSTSIVSALPDEDGLGDELPVAPDADTSSPADAANKEVDSVTDTATTDNSTLPRHAMLAVRLGNQEALRRLPRQRLMALLERYREHVQRAGQLYAGQQHTLFDGTSVLLFSPGAEDTRDELAHGLCCGELLRVLGHDLQIEIADTGIALHLQLALCHAPGLENISDAALSEHELCQRTLDQLQHSRNLLLVDAELAGAGNLANSAVARRLASQPGIYCIERLLEPYQSMVESQLNKLYNQRQE
ncbi:MAG TPA: hypothetical protein ENH72_15110 [Pseudomonas sabulinigri]|uniref:Guanylate cyclase domain-containing protein n=1 Tax=marine sediment metagenome TaxID=412755 RepID=A0A0F9V7S3_9ZZZZ|nr:hypothetical protein [Halopseudomonas sabulinigri]HEC53114.1 hypothetical protein [Halopseudomonas sabulinigri]